MGPAEASNKPEDIDMAVPFYNEGSRTLQDRFDTRRLADRLEQVTLRRAFSDEDRAFIARAPMFFLATADADGRPDCSYKGGVPGFVRVVDAQTLATATVSSAVSATCW
jgi:uncharacterized protein